MTFVFFDIDGTLLDDEAAARSGAAAFSRQYRARLDCSAEEFWAVWLECAIRHFDRYLAGELSFREQRRARVRELFRSPGLSDAEADRAFADYYRVYAASRRPYPDARPCLEALAARGQGIISNGDGAGQREKLREAGLAGRFEPVVISGEFGVHKPDARIFREACGRAGREPGECVYVGDRPRTDALGAARAGMTGVWLDRKRSGGAPEGVTVIGTLAELPAVVEALG